MKFNNLMDILKEKYNVKRMSDGTCVISNGNNHVKIHEEELNSSFDINKLLEKLDLPTEGFEHVGRDDLFPNTNGVNMGKIGKRHPKGSFMDPSAFSSPSRQSPESEDSNPLVIIDPITPSRNKKDSFEPDPDNYNPDRNSRFPY
ncbi:hypothetical protein EROM_080890 [Encephalitozoon romaleae SJ-2008]|uniref:Uncharacterized protein n=1 Tax=Encephalitozoon romaleae (strain SJ-2008) TaxID=1178016 RepID=I7AST6_ENCRO|nr:hypothetical protein EROM_080890 [Encephalitozoon romaleae SJ-2008]AFN83507.1 hypothetical protein EROM_080890 [Encephalitozoon romaleae SJ-2008]